MATEVLKCIELNIRSVYSNLVELRVLLNKEKPMIAALCETWLNDNKRPPNFIGFNTEWVNRTSGKGGGLGLLFRNDLQYRNM